MKPRKITLALVLALLLLVTGCGSNATDVVNKAAENMSKLKNYNMKLGMDFGITAEEQEVSMKMDIDSDVDVTNKTIKMNMKIDLGGLSMSTDSYIITKDKQTTTYVKDFTSNEWTKTTEATETEEWTQVGSDISDIVKDGKNLKEVKSSEKNTKKYEIKISKEDAAKLFSSAGDEIESADLDIQGDVKLSITVDTKNNYIKAMEMDLTDAIKQEEGVTYNKVLVTFEFSKYNEVGEVKVPDSVTKGAKEESDNNYGSSKEVDEINASKTLDAARLYYAEQLFADTPDLTNKTVSDLNIVGTLPYNADTAHITFGEDGSINIDTMEFDAACFKVENSEVEEVDCP